MLHKAWNSKGEVPYCFPKSSIKFQGHTGQNITAFDPNWAFPDYRPVAAFKSLRFALLLVNPTQHRLCSYLLNMGPLHVVERLIRYPCHILLPIWRCGVVHCHPGTQKLTDVYEIFPELTREVLAHGIHIVFLVYGSKNLQQMTKMTLSSLIFVLEFIVRNITVLQWMLVHRDPKRATIAPLTNGQSWTDFCVQSTLGTYPEPVWNKEATQNGFGPCGNPFHGNEERHLLQQLLCNTNRQPSYNEKKQLRLVRRFGHFLRRLIRTRTHGEWWFQQSLISKATVYLWTVDTHSYCYKLYLTCLLVVSKANWVQCISYFSTVVVQKEYTWQN